MIPASSATAAERAERILKVRQYPLAAYGLALLMVALAVLVRGLIGYIGVQVFTTFYPANGFVLVDENGMIRLVNANAEKLFGYRREELVGRPVESLVPEHYLTEHRKVRAAYQGRPEVRMMGIGRDLSGRRKGSEFPVEIGLNPVGREKRPAVLATVMDISAAQ